MSHRARGCSPLPSHLMWLVNTGTSFALPVAPVKIDIAHQLFLCPLVNTSLTARWSHSLHGNVGSVSFLSRQTTLCMAAACGCTRSITLLHTMHDIAVDQCASTCFAPAMEPSPPGLLVITVAVATHSLAALWHAICRTVVRMTLCSAIPYSTLTNNAVGPPSASLRFHIRLSVL